MGHHDLFFKKTFSIKEHAVDYLSHVLPDEINESLDYSSLCLENTSYVDEQLSEHFSDMVYSCFYKKWNPYRLSHWFYTMGKKAGIRAHCIHALKNYLLN